MRSLEHALADHDLVTLRVIGEWWELDLTGADKPACVEALTERLGELDLALEMNYLPPEEAAALAALTEAGGQMAVGTFSRHYGEVRQMGPGRLEREEPWLEPAGPAEALWYRGFLYRGYDEADDSGNLVEYYYLPEEFYAQLPQPETEETSPQEGDAAERAFEAVEPPVSHSAASTLAIDDVTTLLAFAQREGLTPDSFSGLKPYLYDVTEGRYRLLLTLAEEMDLLRQGNGRLRPARAAVEWLKADRETQLHSLAEAWRSSRWNELCQTPGIRCEGSGWENNPSLARTALLEIVPRDGQWYQIGDLVQQVKADNPDFQRPEGNYDTWYIRDVEQDVYLKGFENWDLVEGRLLRFLIEGPLSWLGLAQAGEGRYRLTERALSWLDGTIPDGSDVKVPLVVQPDSILQVPYNAGRYERFQVARVARPEPLEGDDVQQPRRYRLTPGSLARAKEEGIPAQRVLEFLQEASGRPVPANVRRAVQRWDEKGLEGRLEPAVVLRVRDAAILDTLQKNPKTRPYIGERLGELAAVVQAEDWMELQRITAQLGLLLDVPHRN